MTEPAKSIHDVVKHIQETKAIPVIKEDVLARVPTRRDVIEGSLEFDSQWPSHGGSLAYWMLNYKT